MATDQYLLARIENITNSKNVVWTNKKMFGGNCWMVDDKMCFGTYKGGLMARVDPEESEQLIKREGAERMIHGGREMKGYLFIDSVGFDMDEDLEFWIDKCLEFNPKTKSSKKKNK